MARSRLNVATTRGKLAPIYVVTVDSALLPPQREDAAVEQLKQILSRDDIAKTSHETVDAPVGASGPKINHKISNKFASRKKTSNANIPLQPDPTLIIPPIDTTQFPTQDGIGGIK